MIDDGALDETAKAALAIQERLRDEPQQERWMIAAYEKSPITLDGEPTPVCHIQGPSTSSQGVEVVPLADLAWAIAERDEARAQTGGRFCTVCGAPCWHLKGTDVDTCRRGHHYLAE